MADAPKYEHLGARIRAARSALAERLGRDVTQAEVAEQLHVEPNHYSRIERGRVNPPRKGKETLSKFFGLPVDYFVNEPPPGTVVTHADRYPSRAVLLEAARKAGTYSDLVLTAVAEMRLNAPADPGLSFWAAQLDFFQKFEADPSIAPEDPLPPDAEVGRITKWRQKRAREAAEAAEAADKAAKIKG